MSTPEHEHTECTLKEKEDSQSRSTPRTIAHRSEHRPRTISEHVGGANHEQKRTGVEAEQVHSRSRITQRAGTHKNKSIQEHTQSRSTHRAGARTEQEHTKKKSTQDHRKNKSTVRAGAHKKTRA
jgi:hypothetical protein